MKRVMSDERRLKALTAIGPDRPGLVKAISGAVHRAGANIEDSRMSILGTEFALVMLYSGTASEVEAAEQACEALGRELNLKFLFQDTRRANAGGFVVFRLRVSGLDHVGIVESVTGVLETRGVNVASLSTHIAHLPLTGTPMFVLDAELQIPAKVSLAELRRELNDVCERENLD